MVGRRRSDDESSSYSFVKCFMLFCALVTTICGGLFLALAAYLFLIKYYLVPLLHTEMYMYCIYLMCICGVLCLMAGFFSCFALKSRCGNYFLLLVMIVTSEGLLVYTSMQYTAHTTHNVKERLFYDVKYSYVADSNIRWALDKLQIEGKCCGVEAFTDYPKNETTSDVDEDDYRRKPEPQYIPDSCCRDYKPGCAQSDHPSNIYYQGCYKIFMRETQNNMYFICTAAFAFLIMQSFATLVTLCVCATWQKETQRTSSKSRDEHLPLYS